MDAAINNINDLRLEIGRLKIAKTTQEIEIKAHFSGPGAIFNTVLSLFSKSGKPALDTSDLFGFLSRFILPLALNKTIFRHSNFIIKTLVGLVSQKASGFITEENVHSVWDKMRSIIPGMKKPANRISTTY